MISTTRLARLLCLGVALPIAFGIGPVVQALAAKSSASAFTPPMETPCIADWQGPSADNTFSCGGSDLTDWVMKNNLWSYGIPFAIGFLLCIPTCCCLLCCRYCCGCCGGGTRQRPGHLCCGGSDLDNLSEAEKAQMYSRCCINATKLFAFAVALIGLAGLILNVVGGIKIANGMTEVAEAFNELVNWFVQLISEAREGLKDPNSGTYPSGFDFSMFDDAERTVRDYKDTYFTDGIETVKTPLLIGSLVPAFISVLPAVLLFLPAIAAICNSRRCMPTCVVVLSFPIQLIYFFIVTILLIVLVPVDLICNELESQPGEKSVMQWYVIPQCDSDSPLSSVIDNVNEMESESAVEGCEKLLEICSTTAVWSAGDPQRLFYCNLTNANTECRTLDDIVSKVDSMVVKTGAPEDCSGNASGCTLRQCAISCTSTDARDNAAEAVDKLNTAQRVMNVFRTILLPWLDCSRLIDKLLGLGPRQMCSTMRGGLTFFKDGAILIASGCVIGMVVSLFGEKRFINPEKLLEEELARETAGGMQLAEQQQSNPVLVQVQVVDVMPPQYANSTYPPTAEGYVVKEVPTVVTTDDSVPQQITYASVEQPVYAEEHDAVRDVHPGVPESTEMETYETVEKPSAGADVTPNPNVPNVHSAESAYPTTPPAQEYDVQPPTMETKEEATNMQSFEAASVEPMPVEVNGDAPAMNNSSPHVNNEAPQVHDDAPHTHEEIQEAPQTYEEAPQANVSEETAHVNMNHDSNHVYTSEAPYSPTSDNETTEQV